MGRVARDPAGMSCRQMSTGTGGPGTCMRQSAAYSRTGRPRELPDGDPVGLAELAGDWRVAPAVLTNERFRARAPSRQAANRIKRRALTLTNQGLSPSWPLQDACRPRRTRDVRLGLRGGWRSTSTFGDWL